MNGKIIGQTKDGVRTHYLTDALGSVTTILSDNTYRYEPFGGLLAKTGWPLVRAIGIDFYSTQVGLKPNPHPGSHSRTDTLPPK